MPPNTGQRSNTAYSMPGRRVSMPKIGSPRTTFGLSQPPIGLPMMRNSAGSFSRTLPGSGIGSAAASAATSPYPRLRPLASCSSRPERVVMLSAGTPQRLAAASTSSARAAAPTWRSGIQLAGVARLPPAVCGP